MRTPVNVFLSYADRDRDLKRRLELDLRPHLDASKGWDYDMWEFRALRAGEPVDARIAGRLAASDIGLMLVSPSFLASGYIRNVEIPELEAKALPIALAPLDRALHDLGALAGLWMFTLDGRSYAELTTRPQRERFALQLFAQLEARVGQLVTVPR